MGYVAQLGIDADAEAWGDRAADTEGLG